MDEWNADAPANEWHEEYMEDYNEWLEDEPDAWHWEEDYLEDVDEWNHDEPDPLDWDVADYADQDAAEREENYARNSAELEDELADGDLGTAVITSSEPLDSEFEHVYREYDNPVNYQVNFDEDNDGNSMAQDEITYATGNEAYDGDTDDSNNPVASYVQGSFLQTNASFLETSRELSQDEAPAAAENEAAPAAAEETETAAGAGEDTAPAAGAGEETAPAAGTGEETAPAGAGEETAPAAGDGEETAPAAGTGEETAPAAGTGEEAAVATGAEPATDTDSTNEEAAEELEEA